MSLREKALGMNRQGIRFMTGRDKGDVKNLLGKIVNVMDFDFITGTDGKYLVFIVKEDEDNFYFGASVMTEKFLEFTSFDKEEIRTAGIQIRLTEQKNKKGNRTYQNIEFYPDVNFVETNEDLPF